MAKKETVKKEIIKIITFFIDRWSNIITEVTCFPANDTIYGSVLK